MTGTETRDRIRADDIGLAIDIARAVDRELVAVRAAGAGGRTGDRVAQELIATALTGARPDDAVLSEEAPDGAARLASDRVWIVDPLDGTREYGEAGRIDWAVHIALWERGEVALGVVALPGLGIVLDSESPPVLPPLGPERRIAVSRTRPPTLVNALARRLGAELVPMGSAGFKIAAVIRGDVEGYVHGGGQYEWDSAAPVAVARAAGLHTSRLDGSPLDYNRPDPLLPDLLVCRRELAGSFLETIREVR